LLQSVISSQSSTAYAEKLINSGLFDDYLIYIQSLQKTDEKKAAAWVQRVISSHSMAYAEKLINSGLFDDY
jgi:hypothetical protein